MPARRRFWELDCFTKDLLLAMSFDQQDLERLCARQEIDLARTVAALPACAPAETLTVTWVHQMCHGETPVAAAIETELSRRHAGTARWVAEHAHADVCRRLAEPDLTALSDVEGLLWAVATDPRPCLRETERLLGRRLFLAGARSLVFGSRTVDLQRHAIETLEAERSRLLARLELLERREVGA